MVASSDATRSKSELLDLSTQGLWFTTFADESALIRADAVLILPSECFKFVLNAADDTLPYNTLLHKCHTIPCHTAPSRTSVT